MSDCQRVCRKPESKPPVTISPVTGPGLTPTVTKKPVSPPVTFNPTGCSVRSFDVDPRTLGLLSISEGRKFAGL